MKKLLLLFMSMFAVLGTSMAQDKGDENAALALEYSDPADGSSKFGVYDIRLVFNKDVVATVPEGGIEVKNSTSGEVVKITRISDNEWLDANTVLFLFEQKSVVDKEGKEELQDQYITSPGQWSYTIPAGCIKSTEGEEFAEQTFTFNIASSMEIESVSPTEGVTTLDKIEITFPKAIASVETSKLSILDNDWTPVANFKNEVTYSDDRKTVTLELDAPITTPGTYNLDIHQGVFQSEDGALNNYKYVYFQVIDPTPSFATNINDGDRVKELGNLEITFQNVTNVEIVNKNGIQVWTPSESQVTGEANKEGNKIVVTFPQQFTEEGTYTFYIPAGTFTMDGVANEEREINVTLYTFTITPLEVVSVTPVAGPVNQLDKIVVEFNQFIQPSYDEDWQMISLQVTLNGDKQNYTLTYAPSSYNLTNKMEYLVNAEWSGNDYTSTPITETGTYTLDLTRIVVDYAGESYIDEWGYSNMKWHGKNGCCRGTYTWTIAGSGTPDVPAQDIDLTKAYRVKDVLSGKYLHIGNYETHQTGATGGVKVENMEESGDQIFKVEDAGNGKYYLKSLEGHYIVCRQWNVDGSKEEKSALGFDFIDETQFYITNSRGYFKVEAVSGVEYPFCDAGLDKAATWVLEEATVPAGIEEITAGDVEKTIYDITGRRVEKITNAGIYIVNGKKVLVK
ncbi:MAG: hypothetical protein IKY73_07415 [Bacteroidaceae bacterium]|nr:hypothetical protein [Bacteroidaceae bacterium]